MQHLFGWASVCSKTVQCPEMFAYWAFNEFYASEKRVRLEFAYSFWLRPPGARRQVDDGLSEAGFQKRGDRVQVGEVNPFGIVDG